ncbi:MAG TPA: AarF/ABC1/UbiB kinase family protein, partial [Myxococcota bacterium]|nr:AarF/ABC1/UbiB kinase family protein [Myxococcota bacterium]
MKRDKTLDAIKSSTWARRLSLAKLTTAAGARAAAHAVGGLLRDREAQAESARLLIARQVASLTHELGQLKGSIMKAGQMLAMYGDHFLPPEAVEVLRSLQSSSPPVAFDAIHEVLTRELPAALLANLDIDPVAIGAASLGQVHRARRRSDGAQLAIKVQYPGVGSAIDSDLRTVRRLLAVTKLAPASERYDALFEEVRHMLHQEMDYVQEREQTEYFGRALAEDPRYVVPVVYPELCTPRVLTTGLEAGLVLPNGVVASWPAERRARVGEAALDLYLREMLVFKRVQTDPHFGNYLLRAEPAGDRLVLLDFGAVRLVP